MQPWAAVGNTPSPQSPSAWREFTRHNAALYAATDRYPCAGDAELEAAVEQVVAVLAMALRGYGLDDEATVDAARMLRSFLHGFVHLELGDGHPHPVDTDASFERIVGLLTAILPTLSPSEMSPPAPSPADLSASVPAPSPLPAPGRTEPRRS